ncbi:hypothetical protein PPYR_11448 [Photinus pyralis]|uniref:Annexin n=1 Tax=Photinus pyralis TaxID=7054 RepID=A0A5N4ABE5_PHOPY|nr:annexin B9-like [Photinus pyralis]KAB0794609.1 hypothetical protein PPYR_11448 [Photinus pyralis]
MGSSYKYVVVFLAYFIVDGLSYQPTQNEFKNVGFKVPNFDASADCDLIKHALHSGELSTIVNILTHRLYDQRIEIAHMYKTKYGKFLKEEFASHDLLVALVVPTPLFYAMELHKAIIGVGTNEKVLIQILCTLNNKDMLSVINAYESEFHHKLMDDVKGDTSGDFKNLMVAILHANRDESGVVNKAHAATDALHLHKAGLDRIGTDESVFYEILGTRNYNQLRLICDEYKHLSGHDLEYAIEKEFSGHAETGLLTILAAAKNLPGYFAEQLHHCISATDKNEQLVTIIVPRSKPDMGYIKQEYSKVYHKNLEFDIAENTEGFFKEGILNLLH